MLDLLKASFFKLKKDLTLRITLIIGLALAIFLSILYFFLDSMILTGYHASATGQNMLLNSFSPAQNFGIAIPINLIIFTILEFNQGTIRNKVVVGNSKLKIYMSLLITGLIFTFALLLSYAGLSTILGCIFGRGFFPNYHGSENAEWINITIKEATVSGEYIAKFVTGGLLTYVTLTSYVIFCGTLLRNVGPSIPLVLVPTILLVMIPIILGPVAQSYTDYLELAKEAQIANDQASYEYFVQMANEFKGVYYFDKVIQFINPFYLLGGSSSVAILGEHQSISNQLFIGCICSNIVWSAVFSIFGALLFCKRDLK